MSRLGDAAKQLSPARLARACTLWPEPRATALPRLAVSRAADRLVDAGKPRFRRLATRPAIAQDS